MNVFLNKMKIQLLSDLHLEFYHDPEHFMETLIQPADVLVLAGDIHVGIRNTARAINYFAKHYDNVVYVPGNHEFYGKRKLEDFDDPKLFEARLATNVFYLNANHIQIGDITFIGAALWTDFNNNPLIKMTAESHIQDFRRIDTTIDEMACINRIHKGYLKFAYEEFTGKKVMITHFLPAMQCISPRYRNVDQITSDLNYYFANTMDDWIETLSDVTWLFGHTHDDVDITIGQTRCLARPCGYPSERNFYTPLILEP
jgi:predicted phosphodiesterase